MCVILHAKKKKHMRREEIKEAMRTNSAGFYMAAMRKGPNGEPIRISTRTLEEDILLEFFDKQVKEDDEVVMHARIPSYGPKSAANVHGWEVDGIQFCHNMSIRSIDGFRDQFPDWKDKTDSQFFFEKLFIPYYRALGKDAYKDGKFHEDLDRFVTWICGATNKFCFVMPDNGVIRYGTWISELDRKEDGETAFYASNSSYKVYARTWPSFTRGSTVKKGGTAAGAATFPGVADYDEYDEYDDYYGGWGHSSKSTTKDPDKSDGTVVRKCISYKDLAKAALQDMVLSNASALKDLEVAELNLHNFLTDLIPEAGEYGATDAVKDYIGMCADRTFTSVIDMLDEYAAGLEEGFRVNSKCSFLSEYACTHAFEDHLKSQRTLAHALNLVFDFRADDVENFATMFVLDKSRRGNAIMKKADVTDILVPENETKEIMMEAVDTVLVFLNTDDETIFKQIQCELAEGHTGETEKKEEVKK